MRRSFQSFTPKNRSKITLTGLERALGDGLKGYATYGFPQVVAKAMNAGVGRGEWEAVEKDMLPVVGGHVGS